VCISRVCEVQLGIVLLSSVFVRACVRAYARVCVSVCVWGGGGVHTT
jgi:hypothetical protein